MTSSDKKELIAGLILILLFAAYIIIPRVLLSNNHVYTIGEIYGYADYGSKGSALLFKFYVGKRQYKASSPTSRTKAEVEILKQYRYYVMYHPKTPGNCKILLDTPIRDWNIKPPPEGWSEIPK